MAGSRRVGPALGLLLCAAGVDARWLHTSASRTIRAPIGLVFSSYSDLERMPEWSPVSRVDVDNATGESRWHLGYRGLEVSWKARVLQSEFPTLLRWESISGAKNRGEVRFAEVGEGLCQMDLTMSYQIPARVARLVESDAVQAFIVRLCLQPTMRQFQEAMEAAASAQSGATLESTQQGTGASGP